MEVFEVMPRQWGSSLGITLPNSIVKKKRLSTKKKINILVLTDEMETIRKSFGSLHLKRPTQEAMKDIDEGYDEH